MKALECSQHYTSIFRSARANNSGVGGGIWPKLQLSQAFMHVLKHVQVYGDFFRHSRAAYSAVLGPIWPNFELVRDVINILVTCKYEEDPIKNEGASVFTTFSPL